MSKLIVRTSFAAAFALLGIGGTVISAPAQETAAAASTAADEAPTPLTEDELEILVARIALYPDELVALISEASLYPLQIVEASRFLDQVAKDKSLKPKDSWDGSVISLLNYPQVVKMMSDDLDWTQTFGDALTYQQKDVLVAIQQLRDKAVADGVIKTDDKVKVTTENDNVIIKAANPETIYIPQYQPEMLYVESYPIVPITYYPDPYPNYYYPTAPYFAGFVTGAIFGAAVDWDNWGVWGGRWDGNDIDIDCNNCFNNINGKINFNDVDWKNVDRSKINFDKNQFANFDKTNINNRLKADDRNNFRNKANEIKRERPSTLPAKNGQIKDVRKSQIEQGLKNRPAGGNQGLNKKPDIKKPANVGANRPAAKPGKVDRPVGKPRPAVKQDNRPRQPSGLGNVQSGKRQNINSNRGQRSMGGGMRSGGGGAGNKAIRRGGGGGGGGRRR